MAMISYEFMANNFCDFYASVAVIDGSRLVMHFVEDVADISLSMGGADDGGGGGSLGGGSRAAGAGV